MQRTTRRDTDDVRAYVLEPPGTDDGVLIVDETGDMPRGADRGVGVHEAEGAPGQAAGTPGRSGGPARGGRWGDRCGPPSPPPQGSACQVRTTTRAREARRGRLSTVLRGGQLPYSQGDSAQAG
ncbi:hypothetical protein GCM10010211_81900 [Streptomyces albospinus]|uniref:Transposase IS701-like DDE domain-containing protein n=1 Tax=Streptomyces albospinus TaxID=285515 RepID=A0ABQ2VNI9_9ACTN|nr:hypothetical protein GCM10010211_81900 [Streptomyces albospinus]